MEIEYKNYKASIEKQIEKLKVYFANLGIAYNFTQEIEIPDEDEPLAEIFQYLVLIQDNLRMLDMENKENIKKLNQQVKETTMELIQSEKLSALGELASSILHEVSQPLNTIKIICQSVLRDIMKNQFQQENLETDLQDVIGQVDRMDDIVNHMRTFTRRTEEEMHDSVIINRLIDNAFKFLDQQLRTHNITVIKNYSNNIPEITCNPIRLEQVLLNLINNAKHAVDNSQKVEKQIEIKTYQKDHQTIIIEITDNGIGIAEDFIDKVFKPFYTTKAPGKGTGLGLSVSKRIIEEHNGKLEVISKYGEFTTFKIVLPSKG